MRSLALRFRKLGRKGAIAPLVWYGMFFVLGFAITIAARLP
jgi:hypothetical protein